jgi:hypothetical protein
MVFNNRQIARAVHLGEPTIRQWLARAPDFKIGALDARTRTYDATEALTLLIAAEIMRLGLARPHEALPAAKDAARSSPSGTLWAFRSTDGGLRIQADRPTAHVAVAIPIDLIVGRLHSK